MLFAAKVVETNANGTLLLKVSVVAMVFIVISLSVESLNFLAPFFLSSLLLLIIVTAIVSKGNLSVYKMEHDLVIFDTEMQICEFIFPMEEILELQFSFQSFNGMGNQHYPSRRDGEESTTNGLQNSITFRYKKQQFEYEFYVQSQQHYYSFVQMLERLYEAHVVFDERNRQGKTFLMKNVNDAQYLHLMRKYQHY